MAQNQNNAAIPRDCFQVSVKNSDKHYAVQIRLTDTVREIKEKLVRIGAAESEADFMLFWAGNPLSEDDPISRYNVLNSTVITFVAKSKERIRNQKQWVRPTYKPLNSAEIPEFKLEQRDLTELKLYVWCELNEHVPLVNELPDEDEFVPGEEEKFPQQLQEGVVRVCCGECGSEAVVDIHPEMQFWSDLLKKEDKMRGECLVCDKQVKVIFYYKCKGALRGNPEHLCNATSHKSDPVYILPNVVKNVDHIPSSDSFECDSIQIKFHGYSNLPAHNNNNNNNNNNRNGAAGERTRCNHRINPNNLRSVLSDPDFRSKLIRNTYCTNELGEIAVRCPLENCGGVLFRPTIKIAGSEIFKRINNWVNEESVLHRGGVLCIRCNGAYLPEEGDNGPRRKCVYCEADFCEEHSMSWAACPHSVMDEKDVMKRKIEDCLNDGIVLRCPNSNCTSAGQKDGECNHIKCVTCGIDYCYFCGKQINGKKLDLHYGEFQSGKCPLLLGFGTWPPAANLEGGKELALFHRYRTLRLLRDLRLKGHELFDKVWTGLYKSGYPFSVTVSEDPPRIFRTPPITLNDIKNHKPNLP